jgi:hypothetical protein
MRRDGSNILITLDEWLSAGLSFNDYENDKRAGRLRSAVRAGNGRTVEIVWDSIARPDRRAAIVAAFGTPEKVCGSLAIEPYMVEDPKMRDFFAGYVLPDGETLGRRDCAKVAEYYSNAVVLTAAAAMFAAMTSFRRARGGAAAKGKVWEAVLEAVNEARAKYPHTLPGCARKLRARCERLAAEGPASLVSAAFGNGRARKVGADLERLILSIYCMANKPYSDWVREDYGRFIDGRLDIVDVRTGELFRREDFYDAAKGSYVEISKSTCWRYINDPKNRAIADSVRNGDVFHTSSAPHYHRKRPQYSFSMISLDDVNLPYLLEKNTRDARGRACDHVMAYYAYDAASRALIGAAYSLTKDENLFLECMRDMFRFIDAGGYGTPMEVQVEHHIAANFRGGLLEAGRLFPFVQWCAPGNSQEKYAETENRAKKYGYAKREGEQGRFYARLEANRTGGAREWDDEKQEYAAKRARYTFAQIVAMDREIIRAYNNSPLDEKKYPAGATRMSLLRANANPNLKPVDRAVLARYVGNETKTSIVRNMYCSVQHEKYMLSSPQRLARLAPNDYGVTAFWMPASSIEEVYLYQNGVFIDCAKRIERFQASTAERGEADELAKTEQAKYIAQFEKMTKDGRDALAKVKFLERDERREALETEIVETATNANRDEPAEWDSADAGGDEEYNRAAALEAF